MMERKVEIPFALYYGSDETEKSIQYVMQDAT